jgi:hypothetical protein
MGLNLEEGLVRFGIDGAVVRALKGQAKASGMISIGDILYKVNETDVLCMPYREVMDVPRSATSPKTLQFVPKDKLPEVQRINSRRVESSRRDDGNDEDDSPSIADLILENQVATIKKGRMYHQGGVLRSWKSRYFVLSVLKMEWFKSPSSTAPRGEMGFLNHRCTVRSLPGRGDIVCRFPNVTAEFLLELRVDNGRMVMACTSESDKKGWMDAIKLTIDASKTVGRTQNVGESLRQVRALRAQHTQSISMVGTALGRSAGGSLSQLNYEAFSTPVVHVGVLSATNLATSGRSVNALCEVSVGAETFKTSVVKNQRSPVWKQDNSALFEAPSDAMVVEIRIFDEHVYRATELIATLTVPLRSLPNMQKTTKKYPLALGSRCPGAVLTLALKYVSKHKAHEEKLERGRLDGLNNRDEMVQIKAEAQMAADEATHHAARAQEEAHLLLEQSRQKAQAAMAAAREEQRKDKAAVEMAMADAARAKEEAEKQLAEARRAQDEAQKLIEANRRIQESEVQGPSMYAAYWRMLHDGHSDEDVEKKMREDGGDDNGVRDVFNGVNLYEETIRALQAEVEKLKRKRILSFQQNEKLGVLANLDSMNQIRLPPESPPFTQHTVTEGASQTHASNENSSYASANHGLSVSLLESLGGVCDQMEETRDMCKNVLARFQEIQALFIEKKHALPRQAMQDFAALRTRFSTFLKKYKQGTAFDRLVSARTVVGLLRDFHVALDSSATVVACDLSFNQVSWVESWEQESHEVEARLMTMWKTNAIDLLGALPDQKSQGNALLLLNHEISGSLYSDYGGSEDLLRFVKRTLSSASKLPVVPPPGWFIPDHEVQRERDYFAKGSFGEVYRGTWRGKPVVVKCVNVVSARDEHDFSREARVWLRAQHPNVVKFHGACHLTHPWYFVCEEATNGNLADFLFKNKSNPDKSLVWRLLHGTALGLQYLHESQSIVHGDLKCNQVLVSDGLSAKLTDFGMSFVSMESRPATTTGAVRWKAPELLKSEGCAPTFASDVYSFGMCIVEAVTGRAPWWSIGVNSAVVYHLIHGTFIQRPAAFKSDEQWKLVRALCSFKPSQRGSLSHAIKKLDLFARKAALNAAIEARLDTRVQQLE